MLAIGPAARFHTMSDKTPKAWFDMGGDDSGSVVASEHDFALWEKRVDAMVMVDNASDFAMHVVQTEQDPELRRSAIHLLGINEQTEQLAEVYGSLDDREARTAALEAMMIADDIDGLMKVLDTETDPGLRTAAINNLAVTGEPAVSEHFVSHYGSASHDDKQAIIQAMLISDDAEGMLKLMEQEQDPGLRKQMVQMLALMDSEASEEYLFELLEKNQ